MKASEEGAKKGSKSVTREDRGGKVQKNVRRGTEKKAEKKANRRQNGGRKGVEKAAEKGTYDYLAS